MNQKPKEESLRDDQKSDFNVNEIIAISFLY